MAKQKSEEKWQAIELAREEKERQYRSQCSFQPKLETNKRRASVGNNESFINGGGMSDHNYFSSVPVSTIDNQHPETASFSHHARRRSA